MVASSISIDDVIWRLAALASFPYQERYIIGGTAQEFISTRELLNDVDALEFRIDRPENRTVFTDLQMSAIKEVLASVGEYWRGAPEDDTREKHFAAIRHGESWRQLRATAGKALLQFGVQIELMSVEDIVRLSD